MKIQLNADFTIDNKKLTRGVNDVPDAHYQFMKDLDVAGLPLIDKVNQTPLCSPVAEETKPGK